MNPIATPAFRPTAHCIWNSFQSSGKRHLLITGGRSSGKSTLLASLFPQPLPGIRTWADPRKAVYLMDNTSGCTTQIGIYDKSLPGQENKMVLLPEALTSLGMSVLQLCMHAAGEWVSIDEIGYLESSCDEYRQLIHSLMDCKRLAAVVRKQELPFLKEILARSDTFVVDLDAPFGNSGCVIMASGFGSRFGGNKLSADFRGEPLICHALHATEGIFSERVVVTRHADIARICRDFGIRTLLHNLPLRSDTVRLGLEAVGSIDRCLFCPGDQPLLQRETVASLVLSGIDAPDFIWRTSFENIPGAPVLFPNWSFSELLSLPDGLGGGFLIKKYPERVRTVPVRDRYELMDVDTREDLAILSER